MNAHLIQKWDDAHKNVKNIGNWTAGAKPQQINSVRTGEESPQEHFQIF